MKKHRLRQMDRQLIVDYIMKKYDERNHKKTIDRRGRMSQVLSEEIRRAYPQDDMTVLRKYGMAVKPKAPIMYYMVDVETKEYLKNLTHSMVTSGTSHYNMLELLAIEAYTPRDSPHFEISTDVAEAVKYWITQEERVFDQRQKFHIEAQSAISSFKILDDLMLSIEIPKSLQDEIRGLDGHTEIINKEAISLIQNFLNPQID